MDIKNIVVKGAQENNLKNLDITIPKHKLVVITGVSGSGKSSLAFNTIYAEGRRRYVESLSAYARQFLGNSDKPKVESIDGLSPAISIDQKTTSHNPRSTVGTVTEIYDYLRLLYARLGDAYCPKHDELIVAKSVKVITDEIMAISVGKKIQVLSPVIQDKKGSHKDLLDSLRKDGFVRVSINGTVKRLDEEIELDKNKKHDIDIVVDRIVPKGEEDFSRLYETIEVATTYSDGNVILDIDGERKLYSKNFSCTKCDFTIPFIEPRLFSFNSPAGACESCKGLGYRLEADLDLIIPNKELSIGEGAIVYYRNFMFSQNIEWQMFETLLKHYKIPIDKPVKDFTENELDIILEGSIDKIEYTIQGQKGNFERYDFIEGVKALIERRYLETTSESAREYYKKYMSDKKCPDCGGKRLNPYALAVRVNDKNISQFTSMSIRDAYDFMMHLTLTDKQMEIGALVIDEIVNRLKFLNDVGLSYLTLDRMAGTLSGGESQRIRLATQIGSKLSGVLYVLDEPSIGLHQRDNERLLKTLKSMRDLGNSLIVVEHDEDTMWASDHLIDIGPRAGLEGGQLIAQGTPQEVADNKKSITGDYLSGRKTIETPKTRRGGNGFWIEVKGAKANNLDIDKVRVPLGKFVAVTGVSGSGKSSLVNEVIVKGLEKLNGKSIVPGEHKEILNYRYIDKIINITQDPIGKTPRSNPATYTSVFDDIRELFSNTIEAKERGYSKSRFSFNVAGGRCEKCRGDGVIKISMHFLPDVYVECEECGGKRYNLETLECKYKGKTIYDVLEMTVDEAYVFFQDLPKIEVKLATIRSVGLGYIKLGQQATTLSGGEAQRVKLATYLQKKATGKTLFVLDEPTTGLHVHDVAKLLKVLNSIVDAGDTVLVIEHNLDVIKCADHIIDLGPDGGTEGGTVVVTGTPEQVVASKKGYTAKYIKL